MDRQLVIICLLTMAINLIGAIAVVVSNLLADVVFAWVDPRISFR